MQRNELKMKSNGNCGFIDYVERDSRGNLQHIREWHDSVKMFQHWLDIGFCGDCEGCIQLVKKWLRKAKREQKKKEVKTS